MRNLNALFLFVASTSAIPLDFQPSVYLKHPAFSDDLKSPRIVGGEEVPPHRVPYQVGLYFNKNFCGGSLISSRFVLTNAYCASLDRNPIVILGAHRINEKEREQVVLMASKIIIHPHWESHSYSNDVALIMLPQDIRFTDAIRPIKLAPTTSGNFNNKMARVTGWGIENDGKNTMSPVLRYVINPIITNAECQLKFGTEINIKKSHMCYSGEDGRSPCRGDSGAPVIADYQNNLVQIGIVSFMMENSCEGGYPVGLTRVSSYYNWIISSMEFSTRHNTASD